MSSSSDYDLIVIGGGESLLRDCRLYQLVRHHNAVRERTLDITFLEPRAAAYAATFG